MSVFLRTLPFALVAAFFPAGLAVVVWLLSLPHGRARALVYLAGATTSTIGAGIATLMVVVEIGGVPEQHPAAVAGVRVAVGLVLTLAAAIIAMRPARVGADLRARGRRRGTPRYGWIFLLGAVMWTPSFAYLAALGYLAGADLEAPARWAQLLLLDAVILMMIEVPLIVEALAPEWAHRRLEWISRKVTSRARLIGVLTAGGGGLYLIITGLRDLT